MAVESIEFNIGTITYQITNMHASLRLPRDGSTFLSLHMHRNMELHYISSGQCTFIAADKVYSLHAGQLLLVPPSTLHYMRDYSDDLIRSAIPLSIKNDKAPRPSDKLFYQTIFQHSTIVLDVAGTPLEAAIEQVRTLIDLESDNHYAHSGRMQAYCALMLLELYEQLSATAPTALPAKSISRPSRDFMIDEWLSIRYNRNDATAAQLARKLNLSPRQLNRIMKNSFGLNYRDRIKQLRLETAVNLLLTTDRSIASIAEETGYDSASNFSAFVKKATGKTPTQIRRDGCQ